MAENKKSFILYCDLIHTIEKMPSDKAGDLFKHILQYVNDMEPETDDLIIQLTFEPIKQQLKRDLKKFEETKKDKSIGGRMGNLKRWNIDLFNRVVTKELSLEQAETIAQTRIASHTDNIQSHSIAKIAVNDNDNVNDINNNTQPKVAIDWDTLLKQFNEKVGRNHKVIPDKAKKQLLARLKEGYTKQDIWNAILNCYDDEFHKENNHKYLTLEFISRADKMERYSVDVVKQKKIDKSEIGKL